MRKLWIILKSIVKMVVQIRELLLQSFKYHSASLLPCFMRSQNIIELVACDEPYAFNNRIVCARLGEFIRMELLYEPAFSLLNCFSDVAQVPPPHFHGHKAVNQGKKIIIVCTEYRCHEKT